MEAVRNDCFLLINVLQCNQSDSDSKVSELQHNKEYKMRSFRLNHFHKVICMILTFSCCLPLVLSIHAETAEESVPKEGNTYYFSQLQSDTARNFYCAIQDMEKSGLLFDGISEYDLIQAGVLTAAEATGYRENGSALLQEFGAGRDAYVMDHVDNFYTDFSKLTLSIGTKADGTVTATLGTGRDDNYFIDGGLTSHSKIADAKDILGQTLDSLLPGDPDSMSDA